MMDVGFLPSLEQVVLAEGPPVRPVKSSVRQPVSRHILAAWNLPEAYLDTTQSEVVADVVELSEKVLVMDGTSAMVSVVVDPPLRDVGDHAVGEIGGVGLDDDILNGGPAAHG